MHRAHHAALGLTLLATVAACGGTNDTVAHTGGAGGTGGWDPGSGVDCDIGPNFTNCPCTTGETRVCYTGSAATRGVGACHDGVQTCVEQQELRFGFGPCTGEVLPSASNGGCVGEIPCVDVPEITLMPQSSEAAALAWGAGRWGALIHGYDPKGAHFTTVGVDGTFAAPKRIDSDATPYQPSALAWSGANWGVAGFAPTGVGEQQTIVFQLVSDDGTASPVQKLATDVLLDTPTSNSPIYQGIAWGKDRFGIVYRHVASWDKTEVYFTAISATGAVLVPPKVVTTTRSIESMALSWDGARFGLAYSASPCGEKSTACFNHLFFLSLDPDGAVAVAPTEIEADHSSCSDPALCVGGYNPHLVWAGDRYLVSWEGGYSLGDVAHTQVAPIDSAGVAVGAAESVAVTDPTANPGKAIALMDRSTGLAATPGGSPVLIDFAGLYLPKPEGGFTLRPISTQPGVPNYGVVSTGGSRVAWLWRQVEVPSYKSDTRFAQICF